MILLKNTGRKIQNIIHIGDIHVRLTKRHDEYISVFNKFYNILNKLKNPENFILVIAGDLFHNKSDLSPECVKITTDFLKNCADRISTILIAGNHDVLLANKSRLDCLTPVVNALNHPNLFYLKQTEIYRYENILFNNFSVFDDVDKYIKYDDIPEKYKNETDYHVALFHGPVHNAVTDVGYIVSNRAISNDLFDGHHCVILGDIHKHQCLQEYNYNDSKPLIVYCGSLLQQNHGEELKGHGFVLWGLKTKVFKHYEIPNDYGFYTIEINKGKLLTGTKDLPKKVRLRSKCFESIPSQVKEIINEIKNKSEILESSFVRVDELNSELTLRNGQIFEIHNIFDVDYQNKLIEENLKLKNIDSALIEKIKGLNKNINTQIAKDKTPKNIRWKPKSFSWDNMFSYGEGNYIDFTKLKGTIGLFAPNASGKSSIMDALAFCVFDKFSKGFKATHVLNSQKMSFCCKFNFEINGIDYFIEREGKSDKKGNVKVEVKFYKINSDGKEVPLNGEARRSTNDIIRDYVGSYEDFILTVLSIQNSKTGSFIDLGHTERKDLLCQFMGLNVFDQLYSIANDSFKETNTLLKNMSKDQLNEDLLNITSSINTNLKNISDYNENIKILDSEKEKKNNNILELSKNIIQTDSFDLNISDLESEKLRISNNINKINKDISDKKETLNKVNETLTNFSSSLLKCVDIENKYAEYKEWKKKETNKSSEIEKLKVLIKVKIDKLKKLEEHKYDPNCTYCINNVFVKDAIKTKEGLENDKNTAKNIVDEYNDIKIKINSYEDIENLYKEFNKINLEKNAAEKNKSGLQNSILQLENSSMSLGAQLTTVNSNIEKFYKNKDIIENNQNLLSEINKLKDSIKEIDAEIKAFNHKLFVAGNEKGKLELQYKNVNDQLQKLKALEESYDAYNLYTSIVSRDGIPYEIITKTLPEIEKEVNNILHQVVEFTISLETDGKNITTAIVYDDKRWPLEMASGMEKFISGLALRVALINISNLPRPNIICIDEGWGSLDYEHIGQVGALFNYLKTQFDFIWIISHLDQMRDMVDSQIEIKKENGYSKVIYK